MVTKRLASCGPVAIISTFAWIAQNSSWRAAEWPLPYRIGASGHDIRENVHQLSGFTVTIALPFGDLPSADPRAPQPILCQKVVLGLHVARHQDLIIVYGVLLDNYAIARFENQQLPNGSSAKRATLDRIASAIGKTAIAGKARLDRHRIAAVHRLDKTPSGFLHLIPEHHG